MHSLVNQHVGPLFYQGLGRGTGAYPAFSLLSHANRPASSTFCHRFPESCFSSLKNLFKEDCIWQKQNTMLVSVGYLWITFCFLFQQETLTRQHLPDFFSFAVRTFIQVVKISLIPKNQARIPTSRAQILLHPTSREAVNPRIPSRFFAFSRISHYILVISQIPKIPFQTLF